MPQTQGIPANAAMVAPDVYAQQLQLQRQQRMADLLQQQSMEAPQGQMISGHYVAPSATQHMARLAQALGSSSMNMDNDEKTADLSRQYGQAMASQLDSLLGTGKSNQAIQPQEGFVAQGLANAPQQAPTSPAVSKLANQARAAYLAGNKELGDKLAYNALEMTGTQKDWAAQGIDPLQMGKLTLGKSMKEATMEFQPGTTARNFATGEERFQPKIGENMTLNPNGSVSAVPGAANAVSELEYAKQYPQALLKPIKLDKPSGPVMSNEAKASGAPTPPGWQVSPSTQDARDKEAGKLVVNGRGGVEQSKTDLAELDEALKTAKGSAKQILESERKRLVAGLENKDANGDIPLEDESAKARKSALLGVQSDSLKALTKDADSMRGMVPIFDQIEKLIKDGTKGNSIGDRVEMLGHNTGLRQTNSTINTANLEKLANQLVLARGSLGAGVSVSDAERYDKAAGDFTKAQSNPEKLKYLGIMREVIQNSYSRANEGIKRFEQGDGSYGGDIKPVSSNGSFSDQSKEQRYQQWKASQGK